MTQNRKQLLQIDLVRKYDKQDISQHIESLISLIISN